MADVDYCVSCGQPIELKNKIRQRHECPRSHEAALRAANARAYDDDDTRIIRNEPSLFTRLYEGFKALTGDTEE